MLVIWLRRRPGRPRPQQMTSTLTARMAPLVTPGHQPDVTRNISTALTTAPDRRLFAHGPVGEDPTTIAHIALLGRDQPPALPRIRRAEAGRALLS
jgi:hypothetical protein